MRNEGRHESVIGNVSGNENGPSRWKVSPSWPLFDEMEVSHDSDQVMDFLTAVLDRVTHGYRTLAIRCAAKDVIAAWARALCTRLRLYDCGERLEEHVFVIARNLL